jgi:hypothetical protein
MAGGDAHVTLTTRFGAHDNPLEVLISYTGHGIPRENSRTFSTRSSLDPQSQTRD